MSATLTWHKSGTGTKTNTTNAAFINDIVSLVNSKSADANFKWEVSGSENTTTPLYVALRRKDASAGRILIVLWTSAPAGNNSAILDQAPSTSLAYIAWFPAGNTATPSNLTASSGTIFGDDTGCTKVAPGYFVSSIYTTSYVPYYFDCEEGLIFNFQDPAGTQTYGLAAGNLVVDDSDVAYACAIGTSSGSWGSWGSTSPPLAWTTSAITAGVTTANMQVRYPTTSKAFFQAFGFTGNWGGQTASTDVMTDAANSKVYFQPIAVISQTKGEGIKLKLRQIALGPATTAPLTQWNGTGPVAKAFQINAATAGGTGFPYAVNFKV